MKYLCIHGHFYQPPRENAWLETIEQQDSAFPFHDWNERICAECYSPNALARVLDHKKDLTQLVNNYSRISFNFGPTLLSWMEKEEPEVYQAVLQADKESCAHFSGHGSAIAQVYNHIILPLANEHDKETQIKWGIFDFEKRFGRKPEAMWLAETACNTPTLEALAKEGMKFVILAPGQCARVRKIGEEKWQEVGASVDPKHAYLCRLPSGKTITLFFYDGPISQGIAFSDTLSSGEKFAERLLSTYNESDEPQLMHIATDGETYGHHQKFAEMALAYCLKKVEENPEIRLTVYGEFLEKNPPQYEAQIVENTSWSCFHGVERWRSNCGCNSGGRPTWNQKWRAPLRAALDFVRDELIKTFETTGSRYFKNVWDARNDYISLILDRSLDAQHRFFLKHATEMAWRDRPTALMLLEMQRNALLMYTSCGWFFDEISGIETVQIMHYAARALELNYLLTGNDLEPEFIKRLELAPSNLAELKNGAVVYQRYVKPQAMPPEKIALEYIVSQLVDETVNPKHIYACEILHYAPVKLQQDHYQLCYGDITLKSTVTLREKSVSFVVLRLDEAHFVCAAGNVSDKTGTFEEIARLFQAKEYDLCMAYIRAHFEKEYALSSMFLDIRRKVVRQATERMEQQTLEQFGALFEKHYSIVRGLQLIGTPVPKTFLTVAKEVLTADLQEEFRAVQININQIEELMEDVKTLGIDVNGPELTEVITKKLTFMAFSFARSSQDTQLALRLVEFLNYLEIFGFTADMVKAQEFVFIGLKSLGDEANKKDILRALARKLKIAI
jgi:alpha-amylase/alpha-mannosidase (GH57 family)